MPYIRTIRVLVLLAAVGFAACGDDPDDERPIELLYFVQGPTGAQFEVVGPGDNGDCLAQSRSVEGQLVQSNGFGFQSRDATHLLPGVFKAPHYFVFENERQPTRAVLRNLSSSPLTVLQMRGLAPPATTVETRVIPPGECRSVSTFDDDDEGTRMAVPTDPADEFRVEVCGFTPETTLPQGFRCQDLSPRGPVEITDRGVLFLGSIGDFTASFLTRCLQLEQQEQVACLTPATFYMFDPQDQISVAMTRLGGQLDSFMQLDLYRGDELLDSDRDSNDVVANEDI